MNSPSNNLDGLTEDCPEPHDYFKHYNWQLLPGEVEALFHCHKPQRKFDDFEPLGFFCRKTKNQPPCVMSDDKDVLKTHPVGCSFWWKGKLDCNDFDFVSDYRFIILKATKFQDWTVSPCFQSFSSVNPKRSWKTDVFQINPNPKMIPIWIFFIMGCNGLHHCWLFPLIPCQINGPQLVWVTVGIGT